MVSYGWLGRGSGLVSVMPYAIVTSLICICEITLRITSTGHGEPAIRPVRSEKLLTGRPGVGDQGRRKARALARFAEPARFDVPDLPDHGGSKRLIGRAVGNDPAIA